MSEAVESTSPEEERPAVLYLIELLAPYYDRQGGGNLSYIRKLEEEIQKITEIEEGRKREKKIQDLIKKYESSYRSPYKYNFSEEDTEEAKRLIFLAIKQMQKMEESQGDDVSGEIGDIIRR